MLARINDGEWNGKDGVAKLHRLLVVSGASRIPSVDTLARLVDQLVSEIGEPGLVRIARARRKRSGVGLVAAKVPPCDLRLDMTGEHKIAAYFQ